MERCSDLGKSWGGAFHEDMTPQIHLEVKEKWLSNLDGFFSRKKPSKLVITLVDLGGNGSKMEELNWPCFFGGWKIRPEKPSFFFYGPTKKTAMTSSLGELATVKPSNGAGLGASWKNTTRNGWNFVKRTWDFLEKKLWTWWWFPFFKRPTWWFLLGKMVLNLARWRFIAFELSQIARLQARTKKSMVQ